MMQSKDLQPGTEPNRVPQQHQLLLYQLVKQLDQQQHFRAGLDVYYALLQTLNRYYY